MNIGAGHTPAEASTSTAAPPGAPAPDTTATSAPVPAGLVDPTRLDVAREAWAGYDRDLLPHWSDYDSDDCDTRQEVLIRDSDVIPAMHPERLCRVVEGRWWSSYDDTWTTNPAELHIDHLVPLAEA